MTGGLLIWVLFSTTVAFAGERMSIAVCNIGELPAGVIEHAEAETAYVFRAMDVEICWTTCGAEVGSEDVRMRPDFIVRVRVGGHINQTGPTSLELMGRAFMDPQGVGEMVDVYYGAIHDLTLLYSLAGADQVLGYTIAHELGHLLIGAGHRPSGLMRAAWSKKELDAFKHRHLKFDEPERAAILRKLRVSCWVTPAEGPPSGAALRLPIVELVAACRTKCDAGVPLLKRYLDCTTA